MSTSPGNAWNEGVTFNRKLSAMARKRADSPALYITVPPEYRHSLRHGALYEVRLIEQGTTVQPLKQRVVGPGALE